jgi:hypothetical protein
VPLVNHPFWYLHDELESFLHYHIQDGDECHNNVVHLATSPRRLQRQLDALALFCDLRQLTINLSKTKVMISNGSKKVLLDHRFFFRGEIIQIIGTYTYSGVKFSAPHLKLQSSACSSTSWKQRLWILGHS